MFAVAAAHLSHVLACEGPLSADRNIAIAFRGDGNRLALGSPSRELILWDTSSPGRPVQMGALSGGGGITVAAWNPAAVALLATISADGSVAGWRVVDDRPPQLTATMPGSRERPQHLAWLSEGKRLFGATSVGHITVWDTDGTPRARRGRSIEGLVIAAYGWASATVLVSHLGHLEMWNPATQFAKSRLLTGRVVASAHSGSLLALAHEDGLIEIVDHELERVAGIRHRAPAPAALAFSEDSRALVVAATDGSLTALGADRDIWWHRPGDGTPPAAMAVASGLIAVVGNRGHVTILRMADGSEAG